MTVPRLQRPRSLPSRWQPALRYLLLIVVGLTMLYPLLWMIGGAFKSHGAQFVGTVRVVDPEHPAIKSVPDGFTLNDEWYVFMHSDTKNMHVLAMLDPGAERAKLRTYLVDAGRPAALAQGRGCRKPGEARARDFGVPSNQRT